MSEIVVLGAGLGGTLATYELLPQLRSGDRLTLIGQDARYHFVPSNPWVAVGWRERGDIEADLSGIMQRKGVRYLTQGARRVDPQTRQVELNDGESIAYDYLVIATGPDLAFDEIEGLGPQRPHPIDLPYRPRGSCTRRIRSILQEPRPHRGRCRARCLVLRTRLRVRLYSRHRVAQAPHPRPREDDLRNP